MVYILNFEGKPLMPTERHGKVRRLLKLGLAKVTKICPFTIQLFYKTTSYTQPIILGVDAGSKTIGLSATTNKKELYASEVILRNDIVDNLATRREARRARRARKTRYRKPRFLNRTKSKYKGWLAPSVESKIHSHLKVIEDLHKILPISKIIVETASFDIQKIKNPDIKNKEYQQGDQMDFWNIREYVLFRDGHRCHGQKGCKENILNVHHIESRKIGGDAPNNLITLCEKCHSDYHSGKLKLELKRGKSFKDAAFMGIMRWAFYDRLKKIYPDVKMTFGYITKNTRIKNGLLKEHCVDARCISGNPLVKPLDLQYTQRAIRIKDRKIHKMTIEKGGIRKLNKLPRYFFGYQVFDMVKTIQGEIGFIFGRRKSGSFNIKKLNGEYIRDITYKKLKLLVKRKSIMCEQNFRKEVKVFVK